MTYGRSKLRRRGKTPETLPQAGGPAGETMTPAEAKQIPSYAAGQGAVTGVPLFDGTPMQTMPLEDEQGEQAPEEARKPEEEKVAEEPEEEVSNQSAPVSDVAGEGEPTHAIAYSVTLRGRTDASFSSSFSTRDVVTTPGRGCTGCAAGDCVHVRGTLASTFSVSTTVTLPSVNDFPNLMPCQRQRVQDAITNVLAPHEQQHVTAFNSYNGTSEQSFDMTICRGAFNAAMQRLHNSVDSARQAAARALSNALDPFQFDVDLNCEEPRDAGPPRADAGAPVPQAAIPGEEELEA